ncbi:sensor histidine kinase [Streptomyces sp. NRRL B-3229]|uniref:sensor histidine kinase n=1 Tax=Streptomyces sp. NRRL B-3229 TaxID=1463836 RepID=UPI000A8BACAF|nr:sensor histidine kinase [Streptomyces sp. NRRL B-3229]
MVTVEGDAVAASGTVRGPRDPHRAMARAPHGAAPHPAHRAIPRAPHRALVSPALWRGAAHLAGDTVAGLVGLTLLLVLTLGVMLLPVALIGLPVMVAAGWALDRFAAAERVRYAATCALGIPAQPRPVLSRSPLRSARTLATARCTWRQLGYCVAVVPLSLVTSVTVALAWAVPLTLLPLPLYYARLGGGHAVIWRFTVASLDSALLVSGLALLAGVFVSPLLVRALLAVDTALARTLLAPPLDLELTRRVEELTEGRAQLVAAVEAERRRIERDLHDGAQQRLVAVSMALGRALSRLRKSGDDGTRQIVEQARADAREAITELRDLARGLHPPVLTDRGLAAALSAVAARAPVPVTVDVQVEPRPPAAVEAVAYFVVTEALTNVAKHAQADRAWVEIRRSGDRLTVTIGDDGRGGADPAGGSGLAGLAARVAGVDGRLHVTSPPGGPTLIKVDMQCG